MPYIQWCVCTPQMTGDGVLPVACVTTRATRIVETMMASDDRTGGKDRLTGSLLFHVEHF